MKLIIGLGATGLSCARLFLREQVPFVIADTRANPPLLTDFLALTRSVPYCLGYIPSEWIETADEIIVSPGFVLSHEALASVCRRRIIGDIELFARRAKAPVIAITGTNGKSTVTTLVGKMCADAGKVVRVGGNIGVPVLDLLTNQEPDVYVLEVSSAQLEVTHSLRPLASVILNITEDHVDWHGSFEAYAQAKYKLYTWTARPVINQANPLFFAFHHKDVVFYNPTPQPLPSPNLCELHEESIIFFNNTHWLDIRTCQYRGACYAENAMAALCLGHVFGLPVTSMINTIESFEGLPHRVQFVACIQGVRWYNDSKATNIISMAEGLRSLLADFTGRLILILGGSDKGSDFNAIVPHLYSAVTTVIALGQTRFAIARALSTVVHTLVVEGLEEAVITASRIAIPGDIVLLSPACASLDMFKNFEHRGEIFMRLVKEIA